MMPHRKKSSKLAHFFLLPFSLSFVGGVAEVVQAQVRRENNTEIAQRVLDDGDIPIDTSNDLNIPISPSNRDIPVRVPSLVIPDNSQIIQSRKAEAYRLLLQGIERRRASDYNNAIQLDLKALAICQEIRYSECEVDAFNGLGLAYDSLRQYQKAIVFYQKSLLIYKQIGDYKGEAISLNSLGNSYYNLGQYQKAIDFYQNSLVIAKQIRDHGVEDDSLYNLGNSYHNLGQYQKAIDFYQQSLAIKRKIGDRKGEASSLNNLGNAYDSLSQHQKAIDIHQQSLTISKQIGDRKGEANSLNNIGNTYNSLGQHQKAIDFNQQSLAISQQIGNRKGEANSLNNLGNSYYSLGQYQKAIDFYQQSLAISQQIGNRKGEANSLNNIGEVYRSLGQYQKAIDFYQQSLAIKKQIGDRQGEGSSLNNLGNAYSILGQYQKAIDSHYESLKISRQINDRNGEGSSLISLGLAYSGLGDEQKAIDFHQQSLAIKKEIGDREGEAASLNNLGRAYGILGQYQKMINFLQQSLSIFKQIGNRNGEATSFNSIGTVLNALNQPELAILSYKQSINVTESIRKDIRGLSKEEQKSYLDTIAKRYRNLADLLLQQNRIIEALQVLDLLKVQELEDYLKNIKGSDRSAQGVRLLAPELALSDKLLNISPDNSKEINNQLANQIQQLPKTEINKVPDYLNQIPRGNVLLYPFILGDRLEIILFAPNNLPIRRTTKISQDQLETLIVDFRTGLLDPSSEDFREPSLQLYNLLIKPIEAELAQFNAKTILYAPDGQLRYIPIAALYDGKQLLVERYQISNLIAYTLSDFTPQPQNEPNILAGAFGGKAGDRKFGQTALPATVREVQAIANSFQNSVTLIEEQFSRQAIESKFKNHNILHLATHAEFNVGSPDQSFIIFGNGDKIHLNEITDWQIPNIDLIILSACQTGTGKLGDGVEILGFGYQVQKAGAKQAIASLWKVDDNKTSVLMTAFYAELQKGNVTATEALRRAQVSLIKSKDYNHPYYWSAFFAIGNGM